MARFIPADRHTAYLLPPTVEEWLPERHLGTSLGVRLVICDLLGSRGEQRGSCESQIASLTP